MLMNLFLLELIHLLQINFHILLFHLLFSLLFPLDISKYNV